MRALGSRDLIVIDLKDAVLEMKNLKLG